jgi:hypothetical protein
MVPLPTPAFVHLQGSSAASSCTLGCLITAQLRLTAVSLVVVVDVM